MTNNKKTSIGYVLVCYDTSQSSLYPRSKDGNGQKCTIFRNDCDLIRDNEKQTPMVLESREEARRLKWSCDRVWKVKTSTSTGKIIKWLKKNP